MKRDADGLGLRSGIENLKTLSCSCPRTCAEADATSSHLGGEGDGLV